MIDTATLGIRRAYNIQKTKVEVTDYGKTLDDNYMYNLFDHQNLELQTVFLLNRVQKGLPIEKEYVEKLRAAKLVEGRITSPLYQLQHRRV